MEQVVLVTCALAAHAPAVGAVGWRPCATTHLRQVKKFWGVLFQAQIYSTRGLSLVHVAFRTRAFEYWISFRPNNIATEGGDEPDHFI